MRNSSKEVIVQAALKLFSSKGFFNTSIRAIAKEAKISDGLLYNYFDSKEQLVMEVMKSAFETIDQIVLDDETADPVENVKQSIVNFTALLEQELDKIRLLAQMGLHKEKFDFLNQITISKYSDSVRKFEQNFSLMGLPNPKTEARFIVAALDGLAFEFLLMDNPFSLDQFKQDLINKYCKP